MEFDMEIIYGNEDYEELQEYFEHRKLSFPNEKLSMQERLKREYIPEIWEEENEDDKISNRQRAIRRIRNLLQEVPSNSEESSLSETKSEG